ncbi:MAG: putative Ig domain-containing protein [Wenzhouxiangella sp.]|jgi:hypothetical protein|nr:putative Ig domain-containing protein [Wenzhouxiangella sp.]
MSRLSISILLLLTLLFCLAALATSRGGTLPGDGDILFQHSFEDRDPVPRFVPVGEQATLTETEIAIDIDTSSPVDQALVTFSLDAGPPGLSIDPSTGEISWTPSSEQTGSASVTVRAELAPDNANTLTFPIEVIAPNAAPLIEPIGDQGVAVDDLFELTVVANDPDEGDVPEFELTQAPVDMTIDPSSGLIQWTPGVEDIGQSTVIVRATDLAGRFDQAEFDLTVAENIAPMLLPIADRGAAPDVEVALQVEAVDPDAGDVLTWSLPQRPAGMSIDPATGLLTWTPTTLQLGPHPVTVRVRDAQGAADETSFQITVDLNRAPVAVDDGGFRVERGDTLSVPAPGVLDNDTDPNSDPLTSQLTQAPQFGSVDLMPDGSFEYTPDSPTGTIGFQLDWEDSVSGGGGNWTPIVANMDDDPQSEVLINVAVPGTFERKIRVYDGLDGALDWEASFPNRELSFDSQPAVADIDLDGRPELIVIGGEPSATQVPRESFLYAFEHDGGLKWISEEFPNRVYRNDSPVSNADFFGSALTVADLDQDGLPEIIAAPNGGPVQFTVWDHEGRLIRTVSSGAAILNDSSVRVTVVDLDLDGDLEVVVGGTAWHHDGTFIWSLGGGIGNTSVANFPVVANVDDDPYPELIRTRGAGPGGPDLRSNLLVIEHDGTIKWEVTPTNPGESDTPLTVADVNLDGYADILVMGPNSAGYVEARDGRDGSILWSAAVESGRGGMTVFDMNRDGFPEVLVFDPSSDLYVLNGQTGEELLLFPTVDSGVIRPPFYTVPIFADIDADNQAELVLSMGASFFNTPSIAVYESPNDDWGPMRSLWNEWKYRVTNVNDDLTIPVQERPHWLQPGLNQAMVNERLPESREESTDSFFYRASDGELESNEAEVSIQILPPNTGPRILSNPRTLASPGFEYRYNVLAVDADAGDQLSYSLAEGPAGMSIDSQGSLSWTPAPADLGTHPVAITVADSLNVFTFQNFTIEVRDPVTVPDLGGLTEAAAIDALVALDLLASPLRDVFSDSVPAGQVADQSPAAGTLAAVGSGVAVDVSRGPLPVLVPRAVGLELGLAQNALFDSGLQVGLVDYRNDPTIPRGVVLQQDPAPFSAQVPGSAVDLVVSGGPRATITLSPRLIPAGSSASVVVQVNDIDGTPLAPQPLVTLSLDIAPGDVFGAPPTLNGSNIDTAVDSQGRFQVQASFSVPSNPRGTEQVSLEAAVLPPISDGPGGTVYTDFAEQLEAFNVLIPQLIDAVNLGDDPAIESLDAQLGALEDAIDLRRLRTMTLIAPEGGVLPSLSEAISGGLTPGNDDQAYADLSLDLTTLVSVLNEVVREGTAPDSVLASLNQDLAAAASALAGLEPAPFGVLDSTGSLTALLGTFAPRMLVADIQAVRQTLRDEGLIVDPRGSGNPSPRNSRFTLLGIMNASSIRQTIIKDIYLPYVGDVAQMIGAVIVQDLLKPFINGGSVAGIITGSSLGIHVFNIDNSVIEGFGFDPTLSPNNAVTMVGPELIDAALTAAGGLPGADDFKDINSAYDAIQTQIDNAGALSKAWNEANTTPMGIQRGCILTSTPGCRQLVYPKGFASVHVVDSGLSLPGSVLIFVRNLKTGANALFLANFVPTKNP